MDRRTVFTKTAKGLMEATGKTSVLSRESRTLLKEIDGKATVGEVWTKFGKVPEAKLQEALKVLVKGDFIREFTQAARGAEPQTAHTKAPPPKGHAADDGMDLDFTVAMPTLSAIAKLVEEAARQKTQAAAATEAAARAKAEAEAGARAAAAEAAARARVEAETRAKAEALEKASAAAAEAAARTKAEAEARAGAAAAEAAARAKAEVEVRARAEAEARAKAEAEARAKRDAEEQARREVEEQARRDAEERAKAEVQAHIEAEARARKEAEERARNETEERARNETEERARKEADERARKEADERARKEADERARVEAELKARLEEERRVREEVERKAKEETERERKNAEEKARREADELRAKLEEQRGARDEAERKAQEEAERERQEAEEKVRREADDMRARLEEERRAREEAERKALVETERKAQEQAERERKETEERARVEAELKARLEHERRVREEAERKAQEEAERERKEAVEKAWREADALRAKLEEERKARETAERKVKDEAERKAREDAEREAKEQSERKDAEHAERVARETEERVRTEAEQKREAEEKTRNDAKEKARREAAEHARSQAAVESGPSLDDLVKIETDFDAVLGAGGGTKQETAIVSAGADDRMQQEAEAKARQEVEEQARNETEDKARGAAETRAERVAEERRRQDEQAQEFQRAEDRAREEPAAHEREHAETQARLEAQNEETERHFAEMEQELEAEQVAAKIEPPPESPHDARKRSKEEARERIRAEAEVQASDAEPAFEETQVPYRAPINWGKPVALGLFLILLLGLVLIHFVSFDGYIPQFEKLAGAHLQQPVKIKELHLSLVPVPHWRLDGVRVGNEGQLAVAQINAVGGLGGMFGEQKVFQSIELESPVLSEEGLRALLFAKPQGQDFKVASIVVRNGKLDSKTFILPALDAKITVGENGAWQKIALETPDHKTSLQLEPKGEAVQLEVETNVFNMPFGPAFILEDFSATGVFARDELRLSEFKGRIYDGYMSGNASLKWGAGWSLGGEISVRAMDPGRIAPALIEEGRLEGKAVYAMSAKSNAELFAAPRLEGTFAVQKGSLLGVDLARLLQGGGVGGKTGFAELSGNFLSEGGKTQLRQVHLGAGPVSAGGNADADAGKNISGHFVVELKSPVAQARANLAVSGTLREPRFNR